MAKIHKLILGMLLCGALFACTGFGFAQNQQLAANLTADNSAANNEAKAATQPANNQTAAKSDEKSETERILSSASETNKEIENPTTLLWLLQTQFNNTKTEMPAGKATVPTPGGPAQMKVVPKGNYYESNFQFEPLLPNEINKNWTLGVRPVMNFYSSNAYPDQNLATPTPTGGLNLPVRRMTSFGDMCVGIGVNPNPKLTHNWLMVQGVTFIFPTATHDVLGQKAYQAGPLEAIGYKGGHYLTYILQQTWWKVGGSGNPLTGDGKGVKQTMVRYTYFYNFHSGWSLGTQSDMMIDWLKERNQRLQFPVGLQVGKLVHAGPLPVKVDAQALYYVVRPTNFGVANAVSQTFIPKWNFQLQFTPIIPTIQEIIHHQIPQDPTRKHS